jgi:hypothetical protein
VKPGDSRDVEIYYLDSEFPLASQTLTYVEVAAVNASDASCQTLLQIAPPEVWADPDSGYGTRIRCRSESGKPAVTNVIITSLGVLEDSRQRPIYAGPFTIPLNESETEPGTYISTTIFVAEIGPEQPFVFSPVVIPAVAGGLLRIEETDKQEVVYMPMAGGVTVEAVKFNWDSKKHENDSLNIRMDMKNPVKIPEWERTRAEDKKKKNFPAAYSIDDTKNKTIKIKVKLAGPPNTTLPVKAAGNHFLGQVKENSVKFDNKGVSYEGAGKDKTEYVSFELTNTNLQYIRGEDIEWQWQYKEKNTWKDTNKSKTKIFVVLDEAPHYEETKPWPWYTKVDDKKKSKFNPWVKVLEYSCKVAAKKTKPEDAVSSIMKDLWKSGAKYHIGGKAGKNEPGAAKFSSGDASHHNGKFDAEKFIKEIAKGREKKEVNCQDCACGLVTLTTVLGCQTFPRWAGIWATSLTGKLDKPFGNTRSFLPIGLNRPEKMYFSFHVFVGLGETIYDPTLQVNVKKKEGKWTGEWIEGWKQKKYYEALRIHGDKWPKIPTPGKLYFIIDKPEKEEK